MLSVLLEVIAVFTTARFFHLKPLKEHAVIERCGSSPSEFSVTSPVSFYLKLNVRWVGLRLTLQSVSFTSVVCRSSSAYQVLKHCLGLVLIEA
jgi:hypothetical protein